MLGHGIIEAFKIFFISPSGKKNMNIFFIGNIAEVNWDLSLVNELLKLDTNTLKTLRIIKMNIVPVADQRQKNQFVKSW